MHTTVLYGIPNCDTVRKARAWLRDQGISYEFHDFKKKGIDTNTLDRWCEEFGWESLVNRRGTTWRKLPEDNKQSLDRKSAIALLQANTSLIKRPIVDYDGGTILGFDEASFEKLS